MGRACVVLTGFMGAGKTTVGRRLAERLGWDFVDTDALIEGMAGDTVAALFAQGEAHFRQWERQAIATLTQRDRLVIATGGGAVTEDDTRGLLLALGPVVCLTAPADVLWARAGGDASRPLALDRAGFEVRLAAREALYDRFPLRFDTAGAPPAAVAGAIADTLFASGATVHVPLGERAYDIDVAAGALYRLPERLPGTPGVCLVVTDDGVPGLYVETALHALHYAGWRPTLVTVPHGEPSKSLAEAGRLYDACVRVGLRRQQPVIALGGGVVGDLAGFVAATYQRGVPFVQVPTTLLAQIDSSVGGKVAVNHPQGKNLIGAFYQPRAVLADTATLLTLSDREYRAGLAELLKYGVILDASLFDEVAEGTEALARRDLRLLGRLVARCCALKADVVRQDEREAPGGPRAWLNFGHTLGHALEAVAGYGELLHGEAVAIGMAAAGRLAVRRGMWPSEDAERLEATLVRLGLPVAVPDFPLDALIDAMSHDKKNTSADLTFILPAAMGRVGAVPVPVDEARLWLQSLA